MTGDIGVREAVGFRFRVSDFSSTSHKFGGCLWALLPHHPRGSETRTTISLRQLRAGIGSQRYRLCREGHICQYRFDDPVERHVDWLVLADSLALKSDRSFCLHVWDVKGFSIGMLVPINGRILP